MEEKIIDICNRLKQKRIECGFSVRDLASKSGISRSLISNYELGDVKNFSINKIESIAKALNTTPAWIMGWKEPNCLEERVVDSIIIISNGKPITYTLNDDTEIKINGKILQVVRR